MVHMVFGEDYLFYVAGLGTSDLVLFTEIHLGFTGTLSVLISIHCPYSVLTTRHGILREHTSNAPGRSGQILEGIIKMHEGYGK